MGRQRGLADWLFPINTILGLLELLKIPGSYTEKQSLSTAPIPQIIPYKTLNIFTRKIHPVIKIFPPFVIWASWTIWDLGQRLI